MRRLASAGLVTALLVVVSGCGSSPSSGGSTSQQRSFAAFAACLKMHGVTGFANPGQGFGGGAPPSSGQGFGGTPRSGGQFNGQPPSGGFPGSSKMRKAFQACQSLAPQRQGNTPGSGSGGS